MHKRLALSLALCLTTAAGVAHADTLPAPTVEYSADRIIESEAGTFTGKVYSAKDKERSEIETNGMQMVMILRKDKQLGYMLMPAQRMYQQLDFSTAQKQSGGPDTEGVDITKVGTETIEGHPATKYRMVLKDGSAGGFMWITDDGIPVKMDMLSKSGKDKSRTTVTLTNLKIGAQDPQLFEVPGDYKALPRMPHLPGMGGLPGAAKGLIPGARR
ncbi:MAG: DUF4412 domain-containing protein [Steroidobacteraceae bacterium]|jgi:hypothetical protein|nr:DUF4412 domain-containing protein [Steroidobacteraceae bacterium]